MVVLLPSPVSQVIPGWTEGIQLLKEGGEATFYIPSKLAYRDQAVPGGKIGPNSTLVFDVKLVKNRQTRRLPACPPVKLTSKKSNKPAL